MSRSKNHHRPVTLAELEQAHRTLAVLAAEEPVYLAVFARLDAELVIARAEGDPVAKAQAMLAAQRATG